MSTRYRTKSRGRFLSFSLVAICCLLSTSACSTYVARSAMIKRSMEEEDYPTALSNVEKIDRNRSELLYYYEKGLVLHFQDSFEASNETFEAAELLIEDLYTKSVTREVGALAITDQIARYRGDPFEAMFINYYKILNYLHLGDIEGALVESRRVNQKLQVLNDSGDSFYKNDPFIQYLTGMAYQAAGEYTESEVSYRVAAAAFSELHATFGVVTPDHLYCDAASTARILGDISSARDLESMADCPVPAADPELGTVNLFLECGYVPHKVEENIVLPIYVSDDTGDGGFASTLARRRGVGHLDGVKIEYLLRIAMPALAPTPVPFDYAVVRPVRISPGTGSVGENETAHTFLVENFGVLAERSFEEKEGKVLLRTVIRALTKYAAKRATSEKNEGLGILVNIFNVATESADTRSWSTLPEKILMARLALPEGKYDLMVDFYESGGRLSDTYTIEDVQVEKGKTRFMNHRFF